MAPHPFHEANPVLHVSGTDCTRISNAKNSKCFERHCIVSKCKLGWVPNLAQDTCILDPPKPRKVLKRDHSIISNVAANASVSSDLVAQIGAIAGLVFSGLDCAPSQISASSSSSAISDLLDDVVDATSTLIASTAVPSLLNNLDALLNVSSLLSSAISSCYSCGTDPGLTATVGNIVAALLNLKSWCTHNVPSDLNLSGLLSGLGLNNLTGVVVSSDLVNQIKSLVGLVVGLAGVSSSLPPPSPGSSNIPTSLSDPASINTNIINSIINATVNIINSPTVFSLVSGIGALVNVNDLASGLLDRCGCVSALGLEPLVADLAQVTKATLKMQGWCDTNPVASILQAPATGSSGIGASTSISNTDDLPIDLGLSSLLGFLGPVESGVNDLLGGSGDGMLTSAGDIPPVSGSVLNPELVTQLDGLVNLVTELLTSYTPSGPASLNASTLLDPSLVVDVVQKTANLLGSPTVTSLVTNIDALVTASSALQTALTNCACVDILGLNSMVNHLVPVTNAALGLKDWCSSNSLVTSTLPVAPYSQGTSDASIVIGLDHLLPGLGLPVSAIVGDGLGNASSSPIDGALGVDVRRRVVLGRHIAGRQALERRQITDVDGFVKSGLSTKVGGLVGAVLRLVGIALPVPVLGR